jgi:hypothetical protein
LSNGGALRLTIMLRLTFAEYISQTASGLRLLTMRAAIRRKAALTWITESRHSRPVMLAVLAKEKLGGGWVKLA